jgi:hypothetical protein
MCIVFEVVRKVRITSKSEIHQDHGHTTRSERFGGRQAIRQLIMRVDADVAFTIDVRAKPGLCFVETFGNATMVCLRLFTSPCILRFPRPLEL